MNNIKLECLYAANISYYLKDTGAESLPRTRDPARLEINLCYVAHQISILFRKSNSENVRMLNTRS